MMASSSQRNIGSGRTRASTQNKDLSIPTSPTITAENSVEANIDFTKSLVAALNSTEIKESLHQVIRDAVSKEVKAVIRETLSVEIQALLQPLEDKFQALEMEQDRRYTETTQEIKSLNDSKKIMADNLLNLERAHRANNIKLTGVNIETPAPQSKQTVDCDGNQADKIDLQDYLKNKVLEVFNEAGIEGLLKEDIVNIQKFRLQGQPSLLIVKMTNEGKKTKCINRGQS